MISKIDIRVDVSRTASLEGAVETAAWVYLPDAENLRDCIILFAFPGGTYSRAYYDLEVPGRDGYSLAEHLASAGCIVAACDHIGVGDSSTYEPFSALTPDVVVRADQATVHEILTRLSSGTLVDHLPPVGNAFRIGIGHSWGGALLVLQQAKYRSFDAIGILGSTPLVSRAKLLAYRAALPLIRRKMADPTRPSRELFRTMFHDGNVPEDVIRADDAHATRVYSFAFEKPIWKLSSREIPSAAREIDVPIFLGFGARDVSTQPHREGIGYPSSTDITTFILPESAHCFNFANNRELFFDRLTGWAISVAKTYRTVAATGQGLPGVAG